VNCEVDWIGATHIIKNTYHKTQWTKWNKLCRDEVYWKSVPPDGIPRYLASPQYIIPSLLMPRYFSDTGIPHISWRYVLYMVPSNSLLGEKHSFAEYWKHFIARLNGVHAFASNSAGNEPIWMKFGALWVHCLMLAVADFGRELHRSDSERPMQFFVFFLSSK